MGSSWENMSRVDVRVSKLTEFMPKRKSSRVITNPRPKIEKREAMRPWTPEEDQRLARGLANVNILLNEANKFQNVPDGFWNVACGFFDRSPNACRIRALHMLRKIKHNNAAHNLDMIQLKDEDLGAFEFLVDDMLDLLPKVVSPRLRPSPPPTDRVPPCLLSKRPYRTPSDRPEESLLPKVVSSRRSLFDGNIQTTFAFCNPRTPNDVQKRAVHKRMHAHHIDLRDDVDLRCEESFDDIERAMVQPLKQIKLVYKAELR